MIEAYEPERIMEWQFKKGSGDVELIPCRIIARLPFDSVKVRFFIEQLNCWGARQVSVNDLKQASDKSAIELEHKEKCFSVFRFTETADTAPLAEAVNVAPVLLSDYIYDLKKKCLTLCTSGATAQGLLEFIEGLNENAYTKSDVPAAMACKLLRAGILEPTSTSEAIQSFITNYSHVTWGDRGHPSHGWIGFETGAGAPPDKPAIRLK